MSEFSQTVPELVAWARKNDFSLALPVERLAFLLAIATLNGERMDGEMSEGELIDAFRHVSKAFEQTHETVQVRANNAINDMVRQRLLNRFTSELTECRWPAALPITTFASANFPRCACQCSCRLWRRN
jgi:chromosome partition protein MukF